MKRAIKRAIAAGFDLTGLNLLLLHAQRALCSPYIRALNYHDVPPSLASAFDEQLRFYARHFVPVAYDDLLDLQRGRWRHSKPGLILTFDDGLRSHGEVVAPLLDRHGWIGWFMIPLGFVEADPNEQAAFARERQIDYDASDIRDPRVALSWDDLKRLDGRHVLCCHTFGHHRLASSLTGEDLARQVHGAKRKMEQGLGHEVPVFAWVGGEEWGYTREAAAAIRDAGFRVAFMTMSARIRPGSDPYHLQRTNVEASFPEALVRLSLSGVLDVFYFAKRRRVNRLTS